MLPKYHIIINLLVSLILLYFLNPFYVLLFFLSSFLIDVDHYFYYILEKKNFSLKKAYNWCLIKRARLRALPREERKKHTKFFFIFHGIESLILLAFLSFIFYPLFFIFLGVLVHMIEDVFEATCLGMVKRKFFLTYSLYTHFKK